MLQPKPLDGAVRNSLTSSSSESCLVFKKSAWILFLRHFQWESSCEQRGRFFSVCKIYTELLPSGNRHRDTLQRRRLMYFVEYEQATLRMEYEQATLTTHKHTPASPHQFHFLWGETVLDLQYGLAFKKINRTEQAPLQVERREEMEEEVSIDLL